MYQKKYIRNTNTGDIMTFIIYVFVTRIFTVFISTLRTIYIFKHEKVKSFFITFLSVLMWLIIVKDILSNNNNIFVYISYALGYGVGTLLGIYYSNRKTKKEVLLYIVSSHNEITALIESKYYDYTIIPCVKNMESEILISLKTDLNKVQNLKKEILNIDNHAYMYTQMLRNSYKLGGV